MDEIEVSPQFKNISLCFCSFYRVKNPLEFEESYSASNRVVRCVILITKACALLEIENGNVKRAKELAIKNVQKVIVHHEFDPISRYVVLLTTEMKAHILDYTNFEEIKYWANVADIGSEDVLSEGKSKLILKTTSGSSISVKREEFLMDSPSESVEHSRTEAIVALNNKLKSVLWLKESLEAEKTRKEAFIARKISELSHQLQGLNKEVSEPIEPLPDYSSSTCLDLPFSSTANISSKSETSLKNASVLEVRFTRHRIIHNQWVIGVCILNISDKFLIRNPEMVLHSDKSVKILKYRTRLLRTYQKMRSKNVPCSLQEADVIIDDLEPPIVKPKRKAFLFAICDFPDFSYGETVSCSGIITYQTRCLRPDAETDESFKQVTFPCAQLSAKNLTLSCADIVRDQGGAVFSLIAGSECHNLTINSYGSPLDQVIEALNKDSRLVKAEGLANFFCFYTPDCPPLHLASFSCKPINANQLSLKSYTKDEDQAIILIHNLTKYLPADAFISAEETQNANFERKSLSEKLLPLMNQSISRIESAFKSEGGKPEKRLKGEETYRVQPVYEMEENEYCKWRRELSKLSLEMEMVHRDYNL